MNHHHANVGDVMKHLTLMCVIDEVRPRRYYESHAGRFDYPLTGRDEPLPDGVWDFMAAAAGPGILRTSRYAHLLRRIGGTKSSPGTYPGSVRCTYEILGHDTQYFLAERDAFTARAIEVALQDRKAKHRVAREDGVDWVLDHAARGDFVLLDPFEPNYRSPKHKASAYEAFSRLAERGALALLWAAEPLEDECEVLGWGTRVRLEFDTPVSSMAACSLYLSKDVPNACRASVRQLADAHHSCLTNGALVALMR